MLERGHSYTKKKADVEREGKKEKEEEAEKKRRKGRYPLVEPDREPPLEKLAVAQKFSKSC